MFTLSHRHTETVEVKKSRFIATALPIETPEQALLELDSIRDPEATHNCWAYRVGARYRFSDDGEPGGTAGRPILAAIEGQGLDGVLVVVTRFFGGIKLGAGGLVRAYGGAAASCLRAAPTLEIRPTQVLRINVPFDAIGAVYPLFERHRITKLSETFGETGTLMELELLVEAVPKFVEACRDATRGGVKVVE